MSGKVGLKETEYMDLISQIKDLHNSNLEGIESVLEKIESLNGNGGGFYVKELTPKVAALITEIRNITFMLSDAYNAHEDIIKSFQTAIENYDVCS